MKSALVVLKEQINHIYLIRRLSFYELKNRNTNNYLGIVWEVINPTVQILIYWFVFGNIIKRSDVTLQNDEVVPFILWLIVGFIIWIFFYQATIQGSRSIYSRLLMLSKMNFPMSVIPNIVMFSNLYIHIAMLSITIIIMNIAGYTFSIYYVQLLYFLFAGYCLVFSLSLITSTLSTMIRDVHMFLNATLRMFLYVSPILWPIATVIKKDWIINILKLNPLFYLIEGYRASLFGSGWYFIIEWKITLYFWILIFLLFIFGSILHIKFRRHFIDYL